MAGRQLQIKSLRVITLGCQLLRDAEFRNSSCLVGSLLDTCDHGAVVFRGCDAEMKQVDSQRSKQLKVFVKESGVHS